MLHYFMASPELTLDYKTNVPKSPAGKGLGPSCTWTSTALLIMVLGANTSLFLLAHFDRIGPTFLMVGIVGSLIMSAAGFLSSMGAMLFANPQLAALLGVLHMIAPFSPFLIFFWIR
jgi:hypothetical protein